MRNENWTSRRGQAQSWNRNRNTVRHVPKTLGVLSQLAILGVLVLIVGLIYVTQGTRATSYDYELSEIDAKISELEAKKDDLALEKARLTSIASAENSKVAVSMENATPAGYAE